MRCPVCHRRLGRASPCPLHQVSPAAPGDAPAPLAPAIAGFSEFALLGSGGFADVFSARRESGGEVAVKLLQPGPAERLARQVGALRRLGPPGAPALLGPGATTGGQPDLGPQPPSRPPPG